MDSTLPKIYLVRHGETAWTISGQHTGHTDIPLTNQGEKAAQALNSKLRNFNILKVFSSPLQRARQTAELSGLGEGVEFDSNLMEWDYGDFEGRTTLDIRAERPNWRLFEDGCPNGETLEKVAERADRVISRIRLLNSNVLIFAHREILRIMIARWIRLNALEARRLHLATASLSVLGYDHDLDEPIILALNDE